MGFLAIFMPIGTHPHEKTDTIMRRIVKYPVYAAISALLLIGTISTSCSKKSGCPAEDAHVTMDKNGGYKKGKTKSGLGLVPQKAKKSSKN
jgi:hypothetical protein